ncbi:MAG: hypothetical protein WBA45_08180 [Microthrixaceae bacterium]
MTSAVGRIAGRFLVAIFAVGATLVVLAGPASADGVGPTNYQSVIDSISPHPSGVQVEVIGEDSFLQVKAKRGTTVAIPGYDGEPYLRILRDGTVERNRNSAATFLNNSRSGRVELPPGIGTKAEPDWEQMATGGTIAWHDHRIHYMASGTPAVGSDGLVQEWMVPMTIGGQDITVSGSLFHNSNVPPWALVVVVAAIVGVILILRRHGQRWAMVLVVLAAGLALAISASIAWLNPPGSEASWLPVVLPILAIFAGLVTRLIPADRQPLLRIAPPLAAVALLVGWAVPIIGVFWMPNIPSVLPEYLVRIGVGLTLGVAIGAAAAMLLWPEPTPRVNAGD